MTRGRLRQSSAGLTVWTQERCFRRWQCHRCRKRVRVQTRNACIRPKPGGREVQYGSFARSPRECESRFNEMRHRCPLRKHAVSATSVGASVLKLLKSGQLSRWLLSAARHHLFSSDDIVVLVGDDGVVKDDALNSWTARRAFDVTGPRSGRIEGCKIKKQSQAQSRTHQSSS